MKNVYKENYGRTDITRYYNPGIYLNDADLVEMHGQLLKINRKKIDNKLLTEDLSIQKLKEYFSSIVVCIMSVANSPCGFLFTPILEDKATGQKLIHAGLIVIIRNYSKENLIDVLGSGNVNLAYRKIGKSYTSNISSTPSIVEIFAEVNTQVWPSPYNDQRRPSKQYRAMVSLLDKKYMQEFFPDYKDIQIDMKRFVMSSESEAMGFNTNFHQLSRAESNIYNSFCHMWLRYDKQEDFIQIGTWGFSNFVRCSVRLAFAKYRSYFADRRFLKNRD